MGRVYKAYEPELKRYVAIKMMSESLADDPTVCERFLREAQAMAKLSDPHIIQVYTVGTENGQPYFVMEYVEGESLGHRLKREGALSPADALQIVFQVASGLATAHEAGVIHRDIKPGNILLSKRGIVKLGDFGIAAITQDPGATELKRLTATGNLMGTPGYLPPEVCKGEPATAQSDIFSLGIVLWEMLSGRLPFKEESPFKLMLEIAKCEIPDIRELRADVDELLGGILARMIAKEPEDRYPNCRVLLADLAAHPLFRQGGISSVALAVQARTSASGIEPSVASTSAASASASTSGRRGSEATPRSSGSKPSAEQPTQITPARLVHRRLSVAMTFVIIGAVLIPLAVGLAFYLARQPSFAETSDSSLPQQSGATAPRGLAAGGGESPNAAGAIASGGGSPAPAMASGGSAAASAGTTRAETAAEGESQASRMHRARVVVGAGSLLTPGVPGGVEMPGGSLAGFAGVMVEAAPTGRTIARRETAGESPTRRPLSTVATVVLGPADRREELWRAVTQAVEGSKLAVLRVEEQAEDSRSLDLAALGESLHPQAEALLVVRLGEGGDLRNVSLRAIDLQQRRELGLWRRKLGSTEAGSAEQTIREMSMQGLEVLRKAAAGSGRG
jgi:serine/threonine-protein kinase